MIGVDQVSALDMTFPLFVLGVIGGYRVVLGRTVGMHVGEGEFG